MSYLNFYPIDEFAFTYGLDTDQDLAPTHYLGDISISFDSSFFSSLESDTGLPYPSDYPMDYQESASLASHDFTTEEETLEPVGFMAPLVTDYVHPIKAPKPFDGEISTQDTYLKDVKRYMDKHGKAPHINAFIPEDYNIRRRRVSSKPKPVPSKPKAPATPVRKRVAPLPKRAKQASPLSSATVSDTTPDHTPDESTPTRKNHVAFRAFVMVNPPNDTPALDAATEEPVSKKVKRELINATSMAEDLPSFAPTPSSVDVSVDPLSPPSTVSSPETISESSQELPPAPESPKCMTRKRNLNQLEEEDYKPEKPVRQTKRATPEGEKWEKRDDSCSVRHVKGAARYRCDLCHKANRTLITKTYGDLKRHLQSLFHQEKNFECPMPGCDKAYTRIDALKRHQNKCNGGA